MNRSASIAMSLAALAIGAVDLSQHAELAYADARAYSALDALGHGGLEKAVPPDVQHQPH